jgi:ABC-type transport system involved in cytochrome c biogenesis permease component
MPLLAAARQGDPIAHTSLMGQICGAGAGLLVGAAVGFLAGVVAEAAIGAAVVALGVGTVLTGGLLGVVAVAVVSTVMVYGADKAAHKMGLPSTGDIANGATKAIEGMFPPSN